MGEDTALSTGSAVRPTTTTTARSSSAGTTNVRHKRDGCHTPCPLTTHTMRNTATPLLSVTPAVTKNHSVASVEVKVCLCRSLPEAIYNKVVRSASDSPKWSGTKVANST